MIKQKLKELLRDEYPKTVDMEKRLFDRLSIFPDSIKVYERDPSNIYRRSNEWFLAEQLQPDLVNNPYAKRFASVHIKNSIHSNNNQDINWEIVYKFVDTCLEDGYIKNILNNNRERLLQLNESEKI